MIIIMHALLWRIIILYISIALLHVSLPCLHSDIIIIILVYATTPDYTDEEIEELYELIEETI